MSSRAGGLREVVVGAYLEAEHLVDLVGLDGEHEDRLTHAELADLPADVEARAVGQTDVEHDQVRRGVAGVGDTATAGRYPWTP